LPSFRFFWPYGEKIEEIPSLVMVVIDPLAAHVGIGQVNSSRTTDIRAALTPLVRIAQDKRLSVIGVMHFNKSQNVTNAMLRISDSLAFVAQARHCYVAIEDPEMEGRFLFVRAKNNLGARSRQALAYGITTRPVAVDGGNVDVPCVAWDLKHVDGRATYMIEQALGPRTGRPGKAEDAIEFLRAELAEGSLPSEQVFERGRKEGFSDRTLSRAKRAAGLVSRKIGSNGGWVWELADVVR
jgi:putative DNA primase/helicase